MDSWIVKSLETPNAVHVLPVNDLREHDESWTCWCKPGIERHGTCDLISHNSADGRELIEKHGVN